MAVHLLFGQPRFSSDRRWEDLEPYLPQAADVRLHAVSAGALDRALSEGVPADIVVPVMSPVSATAIEDGSFGLIQQFGVGTEGIDLDAATSSGVWVANMPGLNAVPVAEHALALLFALYRRLAEAPHGFQSGRWGEPAPRSVAGSSACIVGLGAVGVEVKNRLEALGAGVIGVRRRAGGLDAANVVGSDLLVDAVRTADAVIVCASHRPGAAPVVDAHAIAAMKRDAVLINVARGPVIDNDAALAALHAGRLGGLGLDVFPVEPYPSDGPLLGHPRVVATAHTAALTDGYFRQAAHRLGAAITSYLEGRAPGFTLNDPPQPRATGFSLIG
jgi:phosphoglycerate dehydrogenase-like enzyme